MHSFLPFHPLPFFFQTKQKVGDEVEGSGGTPIVIEVVSSPLVLVTFVLEETKSSLCFSLQEVSGDDDVVGTGVETTEVGEDVTEGQGVMPEIAGDVVTADIPIDEGDLGGNMADETLGAVVSDEDVLAMADDAVHEITSIMAEEASDAIHAGTADITPTDASLAIIPVTADEVLTGMADKICIDTLVKLSQL